MLKDNLRQVSIEETSAHASTGRTQEENNAHAALGEPFFGSTVCMRVYENANFASNLAAIKGAGRNAG